MLLSQGDEDPLAATHPVPLTAWAGRGEAVLLPGENLEVQGFGKWGHLSIAMPRGCYSKDTPSALSRSSQLP